MANGRKTITRDREVLAWELSAQGMTETKIADELDRRGLGRVTQQAVSAMLIRVEKRVLQDLTARVGGVKARQTEALWHIFKEAMAAWERSKQTKKSMSKQMDVDEGAESEGGRAGASRAKVTTHLADQDGDPRFLDQARAALADIRKIWGADAPRETHLTGKDGGAIETTARVLCYLPDNRRNPEEPDHGRSETEEHGKEEGGEPGHADNLPNGSDPNANWWTPGPA
jgi:hypothetical protein